MWGHSTGMAAWAEEFDAPVYIHAKDRQWVTEPCTKIQYWEGELLSPLCICLSKSKEALRRCWLANPRHKCMSLCQSCQANASMICIACPAELLMCSKSTCWVPPWDML